MTTELGNWGNWGGELGTVLNRACVEKNPVNPVKKIKGNWGRSSIGLERELGRSSIGA